MSDARLARTETCASVSLRRPSHRFDCLRRHRSPLRGSKRMQTLTRAASVFGSLRKVRPDSRARCSVHRDPQEATMHPTRTGIH